MCRRKERMPKMRSNHTAEQAVILIPSLEPDERLPAYIQMLKEGGFAHIVVVDDGSGAVRQSSGRPHGSRIRRLFGKPGKALLYRKLRVCATDVHQ